MVTCIVKYHSVFSISFSSECFSVSHTLPHARLALPGIRLHFHALVKGLTAQSASKAQLGLGHSYSRAKVKFNVNRNDNMIIQSIALLDQLDKDINTFAMRVRSARVGGVQSVARRCSRVSTCSAMARIQNGQAVRMGPLFELCDATVSYVKEACEINLGQGSWFNEETATVILSSAL